MDIIDIMLARAMTPQGKTDTYVAKANAAAAKAEKAEQDAAAAIEIVNNAATDIVEKQEAATALLEDAQAALETAQQAQLNMPTAYSTTGQNTDGYMTQKAVTDALGNYVTVNVYNTAINAKADKTYVDQKIANIPSSSGSESATMNFSTDDAGHIIIIDENGHPIAGTITEEEIINALISTNHYVAKDAIGLNINYTNRSFERTQGAAELEMGADFNRYVMYGGRTRCNVADDGTITAFYGDNNYTEDGSNGQVMVYQPKFYYKRYIHTAEELFRGKIVHSETLILSATKQPGFKLAPIFKDELEYVLLPAFDGSIVNNKLASIAGQKPVNNISIIEAEAKATARGEGWHIMTMAAESANQMLQIIEYGSMNGQQAIESGITYNPAGSSVCYFITGSTSSLGNGTGHATTTNYEANGTTSYRGDNGYRAISYRGMENPWGNFWSMVGGINVSGTGSNGGGTPYICTDFNYTPNAIGENYEDIGFDLPSSCGWINAMGYGKEEYDWVYLPIQCTSSANSLYPVGDSLWTTPNLNGKTIVATGGSYGFKEECGPFYYATDRAADESSRPNYGAKLLFIPTKNATYEANITKWTNYMGG